MRAGEGFIICYSITDRRSFHEVREFKQLIYRVRRTDDTPVVLVGNKSDLKQLRQVRIEKKIVSIILYNQSFLFLGLQILDLAYRFFCLKIENQAG